MALATHVPKEIDEYESKIIGPFTARQLLCGGAAIGLGLGIYAVTHRLLGWSAADSSYLIMLCAAIPGAIGFIKPEGMPMERYIGMRMRHNQSASPKLYQTKEEITLVSGTYGKGRKADRAEAGSHYFGTRKANRKARKAAKRHIRQAKKALRQAKKECRPQKRP